MSEIILSLNYFDEINKNTSTIIENEDKDKYEKQTIRAYFNVLISTMNFINLFADDKKYDTYIEITNNTLDIYNSIIEKNYQGIVINSLNIMKLLINNEKNDVLLEKIPKLNKSVDVILELINGGNSGLCNQQKEDLIVLFKSFKAESLTLKKYKIKLEKINEIIEDIKISTELKESITEFETTFDLLSSLHNKEANSNIQIILKYASLIVDILNAQDSKELEQIISAHALPVGSYNLKRTSRFSIELNAFPGIFGAWEMKYPDCNKETGGIVTGFTTPVGLSFNWGWRRNYKIGSKTNKDLIFTNWNNKYKYLSGHSFSIMLSVIDIGAVVSYRLTNDAKGLPDSILFKQVFAPGLFFVWGLKKAPISLVLGGQFNPKLRNFDGNGELSDTFRFSLGFSMDIPIFRLYHKKINP